MRHWLDAALLKDSCKLLVGEVADSDGLGQTLRAEHTAKKSWRSRAMVDAHFCQGSRHCSSSSVKARDIVQPSLLLGS